MKPDNWTEISAADNDALMRVQTACSVEDLEALERIVEARINRALAAAPPPPVPAQAESGEVAGVDPMGKLTGSIHENRVLATGLRRSTDCLAHTMEQLEAAENRIRELEGEVARVKEGSERWARAYDNEVSAREDAEARADRLTLAAETARAALDFISVTLVDGEPYITITTSQGEWAARIPADYRERFNLWNISRNAALATLSAALREGGKE